MRSHEIEDDELITGYLKWAWIWCPMGRDMLPYTKKDI